MGIRRLNRPAASMLALLAFVNVALVAAYHAGFRVNATASMPEGVYRVSRVRPDAVVRGAIVAICPSARVVAAAAARHYFGPGSCPGNVEPLLKHVAAVAGDDVDVTARAVRVNGTPLAHSGRLGRDCAGRPLQHVASGRYRIAPGMVWLYAPVDRSWDSRYFGAQPTAGIVGGATPVLIVGNGRACE